MAAQFSGPRNGSAQAQIRWQHTLGPATVGTHLLVFPPTRAKRTCTALPQASGKACSWPSAPTAQANTCLPPRKPFACVSVANPAWTKATLLQRRTLANTPCSDPYCFWCMSRSHAQLSLPPTSKLTLLAGSRQTDELCTPRPARPATLLRACHFCTSWPA